MMLGDPKYFVADINCDVVINATFHGKPYVPLLNRETVETELRNNPEKLNVSIITNSLKTGMRTKLLKEL